jgi:hypothetical protein
MPAAAEQRIHPQLKGTTTFLLQSRPLRFGELQIAEVGEDRPSPLAQALIQEPGSRRRVAGGQRITPGQDQLLELQDVQLISRETGSPGPG